MDPNATLGALRGHIAALGRYAEEADEEGYTDTETLWNLANSIAELAENMDEWLSDGGFLPKSWQYKPTSWSKES